MLRHKFFHRAKKVPVSEQELKAKQKKKDKDRKKDGEEKRKKDDENEAESSHAEGEKKDEKQGTQAVSLSFISTHLCVLSVLDKFSFAFCISSFMLIWRKIFACYLID